MSALGDLWTMVAGGFIPPAGVIALAQVHDTLATAQGYARPATVRAPSTWDAPRASAAEVSAWETWYNDAATRGGLPTTSVIEGTAATGEPWSALLATARTRGVVTPVQSYFGVIGDAWNTLATSRVPDPSVAAQAAAARVETTVREAERAGQLWWRQRLGGASGVPAPFPRGDGQPVMQPTTPGAPSTPGGTIFGIDAGDALKAAAIVLALRALAKRRGGRR